jgi:dUTP pyrophosphatase
MINVNIFLADGAKLPDYKHIGDAGCDVCSNDENFMLGAGERRLVHTGIYMNIPEGYECQVRPRSGLALDKGITVLNSPGTIDSSYKGECNIILINNSNKIVTIEKGMRIAQFVFNRYEYASLNQVKNIEDIGVSDRGINGFGSSGVK